MDFDYQIHRDSLTRNEPRESKYRLDTIPSASVPTETPPKPQWKQPARISFPITSLSNKLDPLPKQLIPRQSTRWSRANKESSRSSIRPFPFRPRLYYPYSPGLLSLPFSPFISTVVHSSIHSLRNKGATRTQRGRRIRRKSPNSQNAPSNHYSGDVYSTVTCVPKSTFSRKNEAARWKGSQASLSPLNIRPVAWRKAEKRVKGKEKSRGTDWITP